MNASPTQHHNDISFSPVPAPDEVARAASLALQAELVKPLGSLGRLEELAAWISACQGQSPPQPFTRPRAVVFAGDHGIAARGVSRYPQAATGQLLTALLNGETPAGVLATHAGVSTRVVDMATTAPDTPGLAEFKVRQGTGSLDVEDALSDAETRAAVRAGIEVANAEVDGGADLLIVGDLSVGGTTPASVIVAALTGNEPVAVTGRGSGVDDRGWMRKAAAIRDGLRRARSAGKDPLVLLRTVGGADIAAITGFLAQAAIRRTPVLLDGLVTGAAALLAEKLAPGAQTWWLASNRSSEPAYDFVLNELDLEPLLDLNIRLEQGVGGLMALPLVSAAVRLLTETATYDRIGMPPPS